MAKPQALIPNLLQRQFTVSRPNDAWVTDITYSNLAEPALSGRGHGSLLTKNRWLGRQADDPPRVGFRGCHESRAEPATLQGLDVAIAISVELVRLRLKWRIEVADQMSTKSWQLQVNECPND